VNANSGLRFQKRRIGPEWHRRILSEERNQRTGLIHHSDA